jgi:Glyoxalase/Bleomycin resistance protein/Dioxygenase superfamily
MFQEVFPILSTGDLPRAVRFYRDLLGFEVTYQFPPEGEPGYVALDLGRSHLGIGADPDAGGREAAADGQRFALWCTSTTATPPSSTCAGTGSGSWPSRPTSPGASAWPRSPTRTATG